jgi:hypothetical protein
MEVWSVIAGAAGAETSRGFFKREGPFDLKANPVDSCAALRM